MSVPPALRTWEDYVSATQRITRAFEVPDSTYVWWDLRPQPRLGTLEVRLMDAQPSLSRVAALTALVQGMTRHVVDHPDEVDLPDDVVAANDHRVCRHGINTTVVDVDGAMRPIWQIALRTVKEARSALAPDGLDRPLDVVESMLHAPSEPGRQRRVHEHQGMPALLDDLVDRTALPLGSE